MEVKSKNNCYAEHEVYVKEYFVHALTYKAGRQDEKNDDCCLGEVSLLFTPFISYLQRGPRRLLVFRNSASLLILLLSHE